MTDYDVAFARNVAPGLSHPLLASEGDYRRRIVSERFQHWVDVKDEPLLVLALYPFAGERPFKYFDVNAAECMLTLCERDNCATLSALEKHAVGVTHAITSAFRIRGSIRAEEKLSFETPSSLEDFEQIWHPEYQRFCEHILNHLIQIPLELLGAASGKKLTEMAFGNRVTRLRDEGCQALVEGFESIVRNAISHGAVSYRQFDALYIDKHASRELSAGEFGRLLDQLVDVCHGIITALALFVCRNAATITQGGFAGLPTGIRFLLLRGMCSHVGWSVDAVVESRAGVTNAEQLVIYCTSSTRARLAHTFDALSVAANAARYSGARYDRFIVSIDCGAAITPTMFLNNSDVQKFITEGVSALTPSVHEGALLWYDTPPWRRKLWVFKVVVQSNWRLARRNIVDEWRKGGLKVWRSRYQIRLIENRSAGRVRRLHAEVVLNTGEVASPELIRGVLVHASRRLGRMSVLRKEMGDRGRLGRMPVYVWLRLHATDGRIRQIVARGLNDSNLLATSEWIARPKSFDPIYVNNPDEVVKGVRIKHHWAFAEME